MKNFRTYQLAVEFYRKTSQLSLPSHLKNQLDRASSSVALNLAEGAGRWGQKDQKRFFHIAMGSLRECQAILDLKENKETEVIELADRLGGNLYCLIKSRLCQLKLIC
ncbi:MAG: four helix bundle protein [Bdellovibrionota bacterium]